MAWVLLLVFFFFWSLFGFWPPLVVHEKKILGTFVWMHFVNARRKAERVFAVPNFPPRRVFAVSTFLPSVREKEFLQFQLFRQEEFLQFQLFYLWREKRVFAVSTSMPLVQARKKKKVFKQMAWLQVAENSDFGKVDGGQDGRHLASSFGWILWRRIDCLQNFWRYIIICSLVFKIWCSFVEVYKIYQGEVTFFISKNLDYEETQKI